MKTKTTGTLAVMFAATLWAIDLAVLRPSLYKFNALSVVFLEHFIAFIFMAGFLFYERKELKKLKPFDWAAFTLVAFLSGAVGTIAITKALFYVNFINLSVVLFLQKLQPIFAIVLARILLKEKPNKNFYLFAIVAIIGSYFITFGFGIPVFSGAIFYASVFAIIAAASWGSSTVFSKFAINKVNFRVGTYLRFGLTTFIMLIILTLTRNLSSLKDFDQGSLLTLLIIAFTTGGAAIFIYYYGLKRIPASVATLAEMTMPFMGVVLEYSLHGTIMGAGQWFGVFLLLGSIYLITNSSKRKSGRKRKNFNRKT